MKPVAPKARPAPPTDHMAGAKASPTEVGIALWVAMDLFVLPSMYHVIEHWAEERRGRARWGA